MNVNRLWVLIDAASIIHLRLKIEDSARISSSLFLIICITLPRIPLTKILRKTAVFSMNIKM